MNVNFHACKNGNWCYQKGTKGHYTRCGSVSSDGLTCYNPEIKYGSTIGGKPGAFGPWYQHSTEWCRQLFPTAKIIRGTAKHTISYLVFKHFVGKSLSQFNNILTRCALALKLVLLFKLRQ